MHLQCPKCNNVWNVSVTKPDIDKSFKCCPLHPTVEGKKVTGAEKKKIVSSYGLAVGSITERNHGYYNGDCGGKVLVRRADNR